MKKNFLSLGLIAAAAFTLTNCTQELENPNQQPNLNGKPFQIVVNTPDTKTVNDGMSTKWAEGDAINLFHAEWEETEYSSNNKFTVTDLEAGVFTGTLAEELAEVNDWYALYPYSEKILTPGKREEGYTYIGYSTGLNQTGYNSMASLKGSVCPLYGVATEVESDAMPELTMMHLSSVVEIKVTNETETPLVVTTASLTATEDIVGSYFIDITQYPVVYTPSGDNYVKSTATVNVSGGTALAKGESACLYLAIKPFTAPQGQSLKLSVNGYEKSLALREDVTFSAGKIKTFKFAYDKVSTPAEPEPDGVASATLTFDADKANRTSYSTDQQVWEQNGVKFTNDKAQSTTNVGDYTKPVRLYKNSTFTIEAPGYITKIVFNSEKNYSDNPYVDRLKQIVGEESTVDETKVTVELNGTSNSVTYTATPGQLRLYDLTVYYTADSNPTPDPTPEPDPTPDPDPTPEPDSEVKVVTVAEFLAATDNESIYQVSGTISGIYQAYNESYNNISIYISDNTGKVLAYRLSCEGISNPATTLTKGDLITVKGKRTLYNETPQIAEGGSIVNHTDVVVEQPAGSNVLSFADKANRTTFTTSQQVWEQNGIKLTNDKGASTTAVADYAAPARFYKSSKITVEYPGMTKIEFVCNNGTYATALQASITAGNGTVTVSGSTVTVTLAAAADSYVIESLTGGQVRMDELVVYSN